MHDGVRRFVEDCASSSAGRLMFVAYLIYVASILGCAYGHIPYMTFSPRFYGERELFEMLNWPQMELIRSSRLIFRWQASTLMDALAAVYIAMPWWVYGHLLERIELRIMDRTPEEFEHVVPFERRELKRLPVGKFWEGFRVFWKRKRVTKEPCGYLDAP